MLGANLKSVRHLKERLADLWTLTHHYARLFALLVIDEDDYRAKSRSAALLVTIFQAAERMQCWRMQQFHAASGVVFWQDRFNPAHAHVLVENGIDRKALEALLGEVWTEIRAVQDDLLDICHAVPQFSHWASIISGLTVGCPPFPAPSSRGASPRTPPRAVRPPRVPSKTLVGPKTSHLDPDLSAEYSLQEFVAPHRADRIEVIVPYFWTLSSREAMVCDSCLLSAIEYDGLPLGFYVDMARQASDEARHAVMYLDLAIELMPAYLDCERRDERTARLIQNYLDGVGKLPVPREGNLFSCMWHASLQERLVIMQITTEGAAVASTRRAIDSSLAQKFPSVRCAFEVDYYDEVAHTRIGTRWLRHLCPSAAQRKDAIEDAKLMRGILLLTCFDAPSEASDFTALMNRYGENPAMVLPDFFQADQR